MVVDADQRRGVLLQRGVDDLAHNGHGMVYGTAGRLAPQTSKIGLDRNAIDRTADRQRLPGRQVAAYRGIMDLADNDAQLATVLGHETAHVTARHAAERYSQQMAVAAGTTLAAVALNESDSKYKGEIAAVLGAGVTFGIILPYSRLQELEADRVGVDYMARAGYPTREAITFWEKMAAEGGPRQPAFLSTHPAPETRMEQLRQHIRNMGYA